MKTEIDLAASIAALKTSVDALAAAIAAAPKPEDLTADVANVDALKVQVDTLTASVTPVPPLTP